MKLNLVERLMKAPSEVQYTYTVLQEWSETQNKYIDIPEVE